MNEILKKIDEKIFQNAEIISIKNKGLFVSLDDVRKTTKEIIQADYCDKCSEDLGLLSKDFTMVCDENERLKEELQAYKDTELTPTEISNDIRINRELWEEKVVSLKEENTKLYNQLMETEKDFQQALAEKDKLIDYWEREAKKWCNQLSELRYKIKQKICDRCHDEDTNKYEDCEK